MGNFLELNDHHANRLSLKLAAVPASLRSFLTILEWMIPQRSFRDKTELNSAT